MKRSVPLKPSQRKPWRRKEQRSCEQCGTTFHPWIRLQRFCSQRCFGASRVLPTLICVQCGGPRGRKHPDRWFCSRKCAAAAATLPRPNCSVCGVQISLGAKTCVAHNHVPKQKTRERECPTCHKTFSPRPSLTTIGHGKYCSRACYNAVLALRPAFIAVQCDQCHTTFRRTRAAVTRRKASFCSRRCSAEYHSGAGSTMFRGGTRQRRGAGWSEGKRACRDRDPVCRSCGKTPEENGQALSVDHLIPWRLFADETTANSLDNLVALCRPCHAKKTAKAEAAYMRGDVLGWLSFLRDVQVDPASLSKFESALLPAGEVAA